MQRDFHYYAIKALAETAGFLPEEAQIIAYASEYVDDSIYHKEIELNYEPQIVYERLNGKIFNPICTAHRGLQMLKGLDEEIQKSIYISFHFLPEIDDKGEINYTTKPDCKIGKQLIEIATNELKNTEGELRIQKLIKLGIAIHSYADTWAHQNFSGRHSSNENDIVDIEILNKNVWETLNQFQIFEFNIMPDIGHAEAQNMPDISHLKWRFTKVSNKNGIIRDNTVIFMQASFKIFEIFKDITKSTNEWIVDDYKFLQCYNQKTNNLNLKFEFYKTKFPKISFDYDENLWKNEALAGKDKKWFYFHIEALEQRKFIMNLLDNEK